jgi:hypothetical protein
MEEECFAFEMYLLKDPDECNHCHHMQFDKALHAVQSDRGVAAQMGRIDYADYTDYVDYESC